MVSHVNAHVNAWFEHFRSESMMHRISKLSLKQFSTIKAHDIWWSRLDIADRKLLNEIQLPYSATLLNPHSTNFLNVLESDNARSIWEDILSLCAAKYDKDVCTNFTYKKGGACSLTFEHPLVVHVNIPDDFEVHLSKGKLKHGMALTIGKIFTLRSSGNVLKIDAGLSANIIDPFLVTGSVSRIQFDQSAVVIHAKKRIFTRKIEIPYEILKEMIQDAEVIEVGTCAEAYLKELVDEGRLSRSEHCYKRIDVKEPCPALNVHSERFLGAILAEYNMELIKCVWEDQLLLLAQKHGLDCCTAFSKNHEVYSIKFDRAMSLHIKVDDRYVDMEGKPLLPSGIVLSMGKELCLETNGVELNIKSSYKVSIIEPFSLSISVISMKFGATGLEFVISKLGFKFSFSLSYSELSTYLQTATVIESSVSPKQYLQSRKIPNYEKLAV